MPDRMSDGDVIARGLAAWLAGADIIAWAPVTGAYDGTTEWPTYIGPRMPLTPDEVVVITPTTADYVRGDVMQGIQVRLRGAADARDDAVRARAQSILDMCLPNGFPRTAVLLGDTRVGGIFPGPNTNLGDDAQRRPEVVQNYRIRFRRPRP